MKTYTTEGKPSVAGPGSVQVIEDGKSRALDPRFDLRCHSPNGFNWGYGGSGPAQLALAICADALGDPFRAAKVYQDFKFRVVARWPQDGCWKITSGEVLAIVMELEAQRRDRR